MPGPHARAQCTSSTPIPRKMPRTITPSRSAPEAGANTFPRRGTGPSPPALSRGQLSWMVGSSRQVQRAGLDRRTVVHFSLGPVFLDECSTNSRRHGRRTRSDRSASRPCWSQWARSRRPGGSDRGREVAVQDYAQLGESYFLHDNRYGAGPGDAGRAGGDCGGDLRGSVPAGTLDHILVTDLSDARRSPWTNWARDCCRCSAWWLVPGK